MKLQSIPNLTSKPIIDLCDTLPVNPKYTWEQLCGLRDPVALTTVAIHHDALPKAKYALVSDLELASRIATGHIGNKNSEPDGDPGFPYHVWIRNGQAYICNDLLALTYGISSNNTYTIHVAVSGEYKFTDALTDDDRHVLVSVINSLLHNDELPNLKTVKSHGELQPTACPGFDINRIRFDVTDQWIKAQQAASIETRRRNAYLVTQQTQYMYSFMNKKDGSEEWALSFFDKYMKLMQDEGWFK